MNTRPLALLCALATIPTLAHGAVTASGLKGALADCYEDSSLDGKSYELSKERWPGPLTAREERGQALLFVIDGRDCWVDRSDVAIVGLPNSTECVSKSIGGVRGAGSVPQCEQKQ